MSITKKNDPAHATPENLGEKHDTDESSKDAGAGSSVGFGDDANVDKNNHQSHLMLRDANVGVDDQCIQPGTAEDARPNTGAPCDTGVPCDDGAPCGDGNAEE